MEKSLHGMQTITDGCCFDVNKVIKSRYTLTNLKYWKLRDEGSQKDLGYGLLLGKKIIYKDTNIIDKEIISENIIKTFPRITVTKQYNLEIKSIVTGISTHGTSNYQIRINDEIINTKMRSYKNTIYPNYDCEKELELEEYNRIKSWLNSIYINPEKVKREEPFVEEKIIKK